MGPEKKRNSKNKKSFNIRIPLSSESGDQTCQTPNQLLTSFLRPTPGAASNFPRTYRLQNDPPSKGPVTPSRVSRAGQLASSDGVRPSSPGPDGDKWAGAGRRHSRRPCCDGPDSGTAAAPPDHSQRPGRGGAAGVEESSTGYDYH